MILYALTIFLSAFLLFQVQPLIAKVILPWFGGSAAVWTTCLMFFQVVLLLGYLYAHGSIKHLKGRVQGYLHLALLAISVLVLPITPSESWKPQGSEAPTLRIVLLLLMTVGLPYFMLSTTGPLLQAWYARRGISGAGSGAGNETEVQFPYRLYALSNAGSMIALLSYPILFEPYLLNRQQSLFWSFAYAAFALLCGTLAFLSTRNASPLAPQSSQPEIVDSGPPPTQKQYLLWIALSACSSILLISITNRMTQDIAPIPFLWILPLSLYLLSFILCFGVKTWEWKSLYLVLPPLTLGALTMGLSEEFIDVDAMYLIPQFSLGMFVLCLVCHGELARSKPHPRYLTAFYLMISLGGAMGGVFVGLLAPTFFKDYFELHIGLALCAVLSLFLLYRHPRSKVPQKYWPVAVVTTLLILFGLCYVSWDSTSDFRVVTRNFYGVLRVYEIGKPEDPTVTRILAHGVIRHGLQFMNPNFRKEPTTYYGRLSGVGLMLDPYRLPANAKVGVVGLGTGTLAAYGRPGDNFRFYEINPLVTRLAKSEFTFLEQSEAKTEIVHGDARLTMEREPKQNYDVLAVDAFSGDAIPVHLLTKEAVQLYFRHLKPDGVLAVHVSNQYLDLLPVVKGISDTLGKECRSVFSAERHGGAVSEAIWVLVTNHKEFFENPVMKMAARPIPPRKDLQVWTDDYSNLFKVLE